MNKKNQIPEIVNTFLKKGVFRTVNGELYENRNTYFSHVRPENAAKTIRRYLPEDVAFTISTSALAEIHRQMLSNEDFEISAEKLEHPFLLNVQNGVVDVRTGKMVSVDDAVFLYQHAVRFNENLSLEVGSAFHKFLESSLDLQEKKQLLLQILGYSISDITVAKKAFFFLGPPDSGKSVILALVEKVVGIDNTTSIPFNALGSRFNRARLASSRVNICTELDSSKMKNIDAFKAITSNERIMGEHKGKEPFEFTVRTKLLSAGNVMPALPELVGSDAIVRRMVILRFTRSTSEKDPELLEKLWGERDTIFSLAIKELASLCKNGYTFIQPQDSVAYFQEMQACCRSVDDFISDRCELKPDAQIHFVALWEEFCGYCDENGYDRLISKLQFGQKIAALPGITRTRFRRNCKPLRGYRGIRIKEHIISPQDSDESDKEKR